MTCALNFVFNGREISLPGKTVCKAQVAVTWFTGFLPAWICGRVIAWPWTNHIDSEYVFLLYQSFCTREILQTARSVSVTFATCPVSPVVSMGCRNHQDQTHQGMVWLHTQFRHSFWVWVLLSHCGTLCTDAWRDLCRGPCLKLLRRGMSLAV